MYEDFSKTVAPKYWRLTGHHFTELKKMKEDIDKFQEITKEDKENDWVRDQISESNEIEETEDDLKKKIDNMTHRELSSLWRHGSSDNKLFHGKVGEYFKDRLFNHFGGFNSNLSKSIGW